MTQVRLGRLLTLKTNKNAVIRTALNLTGSVFGGGGGNRTRVRKSSAVGSTCLADSIVLTACYPNGRENERRVRRVLVNQRRTSFITIL